MPLLPCPGSAPIAQALCLHSARSVLTEAKGCSSSPLPALPLQPRAHQGYPPARAALRQDKVEDREQQSPSSPQPHAATQGSPKPPQCPSHPAVQCPMPEGGDMPMGYSPQEGSVPCSQAQGSPPKQPCVLMGRMSLMLVEPWMLSPRAGASQGSAQAPHGVSPQRTSGPGERWPPGWV